MKDTKNHNYSPHVTKRIQTCYEFEYSPNKGDTIATGQQLNKVLIELEEKKLNPKVIHITATTVGNIEYNYFLGADSLWVIIEHLIEV
jgi:hypothetical protein